MHLKNWSLIYPEGDGPPALSPIYDMLSTVPYLPADGMALTLGGERSFKALTPSRWKAFANRARLPEPAVLAAVATGPSTTQPSSPLASSAAARPRCERGVPSEKAEEIEEIRKEDSERCNMAGKSTPVIAAMPRAGRAGHR